MTSSQYYCTNAPLPVCLFFWQQKSAGGYDGRCGHTGAPYMAAATRAHHTKKARAIMRPRRMHVTESGGAGAGPAGAPVACAHARGPQLRAGGRPPRRTKTGPPQNMHGWLGARGAARCQPFQPSTPGLSRGGRRRGKVRAKGNAYII